MRRLGLAVVVALSLAAPGQDLPKARALLEQALKELQAPTATTAIATPAALDAAIAAAGPGAVLTLSPTLVYPAPLVITKAVTLQSLVPLTRMDATTALPSFRGGVTVPADDVTLVGLEVKASDPRSAIVVFSGARVVLDRVRILGDPTKGAKHGVVANGNGACAIRRSYIDDCFLPSPGDDAQAILAWDLAPGLLIEDNFLRAGSETILIGGGDAVTAARMAHDVTIRNNWITARPEWMTQSVGVKTRLELKAVDGALIEGNRIEYCWRQGQGGYLVSFTVRNQNGRAPWSTIRNVVFRNNDLAHGSAAFNLLAVDDTQPSTIMATVSITGNRVTDLDPLEYRGGSKRMIQIAGGPADLAITTNTFAGIHLTSAIYFTGTAMATTLTISGNTWPRTPYGIFGDGATVGQAWARFVTSGTLGQNTETP
jgi:hypothetical protein